MPFIELLRCHIKTPFVTAFAYGSGVFKQKQTEMTAVSDKISKMIDYLVVVRDAELSEWHENNSKVNPLDYPILGKLAVTKSKLFDGAVYYVPNVSVSGGKKIKYGVLGWDTLLRDLYTWESMFIAGRLQKPTIQSEIGDGEMKKVLDGAMEFNLDSALRTSVLINSRDSNDFLKVLKSVVSLSYTNDPRLMLAESPQKVENIVRGQLKELEALYLERYENLKDDFGWLGDPKVRMQLISNLPLNLKTELLNGSPSLWHVALNNEKTDLITKAAVGRIVRRPAWRQMILGAISTSPSTAFNYALAKVKKRFNK